MLVTEYMPRPGAVNYVISVIGRSPDTVVSQRWPYVLLRLRDSCVPDPHYSPLLR